KYLPRTKPLKRVSANLHLNFPFENIDNRMRIMPADRVDGSWGVIDSNDFNLFTRCFWKLFRKERIHLLGMRCRGKSEGKDKYKEDELHVMHRFCLKTGVPCEKWEGCSASEIEDYVDIGR